MSRDFVNRKSELMFIKDWVNSSSEQNEGVFVYSKSGIGKSQFVSELFEIEFSNLIKIKVDIVSSDALSVESYSFLKCLYRRVIQMTEKDSTLPIKKRISLDPNVSLSYIAGINFSFADKSGYAEQVTQIMSYLTKKLSGNDTYIIDIENFQLVDAESMECLKHLFCVGKRHRFIFEFTVDPNSITPGFYHLFSQISAVMECKMYELKKLKLKEIEVLCERKNLPLNAAKTLYEENDGNLFPIIMLPFSPISNSIQPLFDIIDSLSIDQRIVLFLVELAQGETTIKTIQSIFDYGSCILTGSKKYSNSYLNSKCIELKKKKLIKTVGQVVKIGQDQLLDVIISYRNQPEYYLAWNLYENYHNESIRGLSVEEREPHILALLHIYSVFPDIKLYSILPDLTAIILRSPHNKMIEKIKTIIRQLESHGENHNLVVFLVRYLADVCIAVGQWSIALNQIEERYSEDIPWQACYLSATLAANPQIPDAEDRILRMRKKHKINIHSYMSITVSILSYYMRTMPELKVKMIAEVYLKEFSGYQNLNYAFLLKMYSNTLCNEDALKALNQCNEIFRKYRREDLVAMNMITIASRNVYMGHPEIGLEILKSVEKSIKNQNILIRSQYLLNNRSAICLLTGDYDEQTQRDLTVAFFATDSIFEKAIILCNLMIYFIRSNKMAEAEKVFKHIQLLELSQYNNVDLKFILLKNVLFYYEVMRNKEKTQQAYADLVSFALSEDCPEDIRVHALSLFPQDYPQYSSETKPFFAQFRFQADFIGYWQCEVCYDVKGKNHLKELMEHLDTMHFES